VKRDGVGRQDGAVPLRIAVVCLGNICRSPMAATVLRSKIGAAGLADEVEVTSAGTGDWHVGAAADRRARAALRTRGYPDEHRARQFTAADFADVDLVLAMDGHNLRDLRRLAAAADLDNIRLFDGTAEVPDPYYGDRSDFDAVLDQIEAACDRLVVEARALVARTN
jgi:protein-tyrosine phosphatase